MNPARILKYVWPFFNITNKGLSLNFYIWYVIEMYTIDTSRKRCLLVMLSCSIHVCFTRQELFLLISEEIQIGQNHSFLSSGRTCENRHYVKSIQMKSFFCSLFSHIWTEYENLRSKPRYSVQMWENTDQKKLRTWTVFTQWENISISHEMTRSLVLFINSDL